MPRVSEGAVGSGFGGTIDVFVAGLVSVWLVAGVGVLCVEGKGRGGGGHVALAMESVALSNMPQFMCRG